MNGKHNDVGFVEMSKLFVVREVFSIGMEPFVRAYLSHYDVLPMSDQIKSISRQLNAFACFTSEAHISSCSLSDAKGFYDNPMKHPLNKSYQSLFLLDVECNWYSASTADGLSCGLSEALVHSLWVNDSAFISNFFGLACLCQSGLLKYFNTGVICLMHFASNAIYL